MYDQESTIFSQSILAIYPPSCIATPGKPKSTIRRNVSGPYQQVLRRPTNRYTSALSWPYSKGHSLRSL
jgi:hypothetical protein